MNDGCSCVVSMEELQQVSVLKFKPTVGANPPLGRQPDKLNTVRSLQRLQKPTACVYPDPHQSRTGRITLILSFHVSPRLSNHLSPSYLSTKILPAFYSNPSDTCPVWSCLLCHISGLSIEDTNYEPPNHIHSSLSTNLLSI